MKFWFNIVLSIFAGVGLAWCASLFFVSPPTTQTTLDSLPVPQQITQTSAPILTPNVKTVTRLSPPADRVLFINGSIGMDEGNGDELVQSIYKMGMSNDPLYIKLDSPGGSVLTGSAIITAVESARGPVYTICDQICASMAAMIFEYGTKRYMTDRSFVMFHPASGAAEGEIDKMLSRLLSISHYIGRMEAYIANRANISYDTYKSLASRELWLDSEDAVDRHFADEIVSVNLPDPPAKVSILSTPTNKVGVTIAPMVFTPRYTWHQ